ncbi:hypothetical protein K491DRAFT_336262 [Lophiostoma macrostomum CBS 122681]|uniref:Uncharacterized protein n=1 Tax=Lophiostoma macrostomum CBS 122681 TaxID=1314788 RepID=A0A6A6TPG6_9PLEO|nr:hypothetical protein K491DRAFT_336262 [Lophiostoma macrostomum CBS 122681]
MDLLTKRSVRRLNWAIISLATAFLVQLRTCLRLPNAEHSSVESPRYTKLSAFRSCLSPSIDAGIDGISGVNRTCSLISTPLNGLFSTLVTCFRRPELVRRDCLANGNVADPST